MVAKKNIFRIFALFLLLIVSNWILSCKDDEPEPMVSITSFSPVSAFAGEIVTISGQNFSTTPANNSVMFNGTTAEVSAATPATLTVKVPAAATTGKIRVRVNGNTATSETDFTILQTSITGFSPASGIAGTTIIITGTNFNSLPSGNSVSFNGISAAVSAASPTQLTVTVPETATTGKITVVTGGRTATSSADFSVLQTSITGFIPSSATVGATVIISGTNFAVTPGANIVTFNGAVAAVSAASGTQLTVTVPAGATTGKISVSINGKTTSSGTDFTVLLPTITDFSPAVAQVGTEITINGANFSATPSENSVHFIDMASATVVSATASQLVVIVPENAYSGKISVTVNGKTATSATNFTVSTPNIAGFYPPIGVSNIPVVITGANFSTVAHFNVVKFNDVQATVTSATATQLNVTVPAGATTGRISVEAGGGMAFSQFEFEICDAASELMISDVAITNISTDKTSFTFTFKVTNFGAVSADLTKIEVISHVSSDELSSMDDLSAGTFSLTSGGTLSTGESYQATWTSDLGVGNTITTYPYLIFLIHASPNGSVPECDIADNVAVKRIE